MRPVADETDLDIVGNLAHLPPWCICCGVKTGERYAVQRRDSLYLLLVVREVRLGYCAECQRHATSFGEGERQGLLRVILKTMWWTLMLATIPAGLIALAGAPYVADAVWLGAVVGRGSLAGWRRYQCKPRGELGREHARRGWAAEVVSFRRKTTRLRLYSPRYAEALRIANPQAVVPPA